MSDIPVVIRIEAKQDSSVAASAQATQASFAATAAAAKKVVDQQIEDRKRLMDAARSAGVEEGKIKQVAAQLAKQLAQQEAAAQKDSLAAIKQATQDLAEAQKQAAREAAEAGKRAAEEVREANRKTADEAKEHANQVKESARALKEVLGGIGLGLGIGELVRGVVELGKAMLEESSAFEQYQQRLEVIGHSASLARGQMQMAVDMASHLPFDVGQVTGAVVALEKFHASASELLPVAADMAAIMGVALPDAAQALGKAWDGSEGGVRQLRDSFGITNEMLRQHGALVGKNGELYIHSTEGMEKYHKALKEILHEFDGGADKQAHTFAGELSNLRDAMVLLGKEIGDDWMPKAKVWVETLTSLGRAAREAYEGFHSAGVAQSPDELKRHQIDSKKSTIRQLLADNTPTLGGGGIYDNKIATLRKEIADLQSQLDVSQKSKGVDITSATGEQTKWGNLAGQAKKMTPAEIMDLLRSQGIQGGLQELVTKRKEETEKQQAAISDSALSPADRLKLARPYDEAGKSLDQLIAKLQPATDAVGELEKAGDRSKAALDYSKQMKGITDYKIALQEVQKDLHQDRAALQKLGIGTDSDSVIKYGIDHADQPESEGLKAVNRFAQDTQRLREIQNAQKKPIDKAAKKATRDATFELSEKVKNFTEDTRVEQDKFKTDLDLHKITEAEYARHLAAMADKVEQFSKANRHALEGEKGHGLERGLDTLEAGLRVGSAQATDKDEAATARAVKAAQEVARHNLELSLHTDDRRISTVDKNQLDAQMADLDKEVAAVRDAEDKKVITHEEASAKLEAIDDKRLSLVQANAAKEEAAHLRVLSAFEKLGNLKLKDDERAGASQEQLAKDIQSNLDLKLQAIETTRQKELEAHGDVTAATLEAQAAEQDARASAIDQIDALQQKAQGKGAGSSMTGPMNSDQAFAYLNQATQSSWYSKDSGLTPFSIGDKSQPAETGPLADLKAALKGPADLYKTSAESFAQSVAAFGASIGQQKSGLASGFTSAAGNWSPPGSAGGSGATREQQNQAAAIGPRIDPSTMGGGNANYNVTGGVATGASQSTNTFHINTKISGGSPEMEDAANKLAAMALQHVDAA